MAAPEVAAEGPWRGCGRTDTGAVREQRIELAGACQPWRRIELTLDTPTEAGESVIRLWSNLPERIEARQIAQLYRRRWCVEMCQSWRVISLMGVHGKTSAAAAALA
jgi:IS4 transposase